MLITGGSRGISAATAILAAKRGYIFSPLVLEKIPSEKQTDITQLTLIFQNQMQLSINMPEHRLVSFLLELGYATTIVR